MTRHRFGVREHYKAFDALTDAEKASIEQQYRDGENLKVIAKSVGVSRRSIQRWVAKGLLNVTPRLYGNAKRAGTKVSSKPGDEQHHGDSDPCSDTGFLYARRLDFEQRWWM